MRRVLVRYRVRPDQAQENERLIGAVFAELERERPAGLRYASFRLDDGVTFVHLASIETADGSNPLAGLIAFREFTARIGARCQEPPVTVDLTQVGAYRLFGGT